jgi:hypothetical protein
MAAGRSAGVDPLGRTLELDEGDLVLFRGADAQAGRTLAQIHGLPALSQALRLTLLTQLGSDPLSAVFGFDLRALGAGGYGARTRLEHVRLEIVRCIGADRRVREIRDVTFSPEAERRVRARVEIDAGLGTPLQITVTVPRA